MVNGMEPGRRSTVDTSVDEAGESVPSAGLQFPPTDTVLGHAAKRSPLAKRSSNSLPFSVTFVMEQHLGHRTYAENLRRSLTHEDGLRTAWVPIRYEETSHWWERIPFEPVRAALRGRVEVVMGLARSGDADAYVFNSQVPAVLGGRRSRRRPFVVCMDDTPVLKDSMAEGYSHRADSRFVGSVKHWWNRRVLRRAGGLAPWSHWVRRSLIDDYGIDPALIEVIPPGVDTRAWQPATHWSNGPMRILFVGGDFERKGGPLLLRAFRALDPGSARLSIVTRSNVLHTPGVEVYTSLSQNDPELRRLFAASDVFVLPSSFEMFGIAAVEAAAAGLPAIVSDVGGLGDLVIEGETGYAIVADDCDALVDRLRTLAHDPKKRRQMGRAARRRAEIEFDADTNAQRLVALARRAAQR